MQLHKEGTQLLMQIYKPFRKFSPTLHCVHMPAEALQLFLSSPSLRLKANVNVQTCKQLHFLLPGSYSPGFEWSRITKVLKVAVPAVLGQLSVALQGAGLVYTSGAQGSIVSGILQTENFYACLLLFASHVTAC